MVIKQRSKYRIPKEALDHIFARRYLIQFGLNPHTRINLVSVCTSCHGGKRTAEDRLFYGDALNFVKFVVTHHWPLQKVIRAARYYGLKEIASLIQRGAYSTWL